MTSFKTMSSLCAYAPVLAQGLDAANCKLAPLQLQFFYRSGNTCPSLAGSLAHAQSLATTLAPGLRLDITLRYREESERAYLALGTICPGIILNISLMY